MAGPRRGDRRPRRWDSSMRLSGPIGAGDGCVVLVRER
jgi:hypothetical protein